MCSEEFDQKQNKSMVAWRKKHGLYGADGGREVGWGSQVVEG